MPDIHDYPLAEVLNFGDVIHQARPVALFGSRIETRCGLKGYKTGRDGGIWCPRCLELAREEAKAGDGRGPFRDDLRSQLVAAGTAAAEQWLIDRANRKMSDVNRRRLAGHVVNALWSEIERVVMEMAPYFGDEEMAAMTARAEKAEAESGRLRGLLDAEMAACKRWLWRTAEAGKRAMKAEAEAGETRDALKVAMELLDRLADDGPCRLDHHGYCVTHSLHEAPCPHPLARQLVAAWREVEQEVPDA